MKRVLEALGPGNMDAALREHLGQTAGEGQRKTARWAERERNAEQLFQ